MSATANARAFLAAFRLTGNITKAADAAKIERTMHYRWLRSSPSYKKAFTDAHAEVGDMLEGEAIRRANEGVLEPVYYQGVACGAIRVYSDGLMLSLLKAFKPEKYRERVSAEVSGPGGGPIPIAHADLAVLTDEELAQLIAVTAKLEAAQGAPGRADPPSPSED